MCAAQAGTCARTHAARARHPGRSSPGYDHVEIASELGPGKMTDDGKRIPMDLKVGDVVIYAKYAGTEIKVKTERQEVNLSLAEMDLGSWVLFELPGFTKAASGTEQPSMDALRKATATSYFKSGDALWVKLVVTKAPLPIVRPTDLQASIAVSR